MKEEPKQKTLRVAIAAGGTGGHIMPALALAEALGNIGYPTEVEYFCGTRPVERNLYEAAGIKPHTIPVRTASAPTLARRLRLMWGLGWGLVKSLWHMRRCDILVAMGGYTTAPVLVAARILRRPMILHESNTVLGRVNRMMAPHARAIVCGMPLTSAPEGVDPEKIHELGTPVRVSVHHGDPQEAGDEMYLKPGVFTLLIYGGSLGARGLNRVMARTLGHIGERLLRDEPFQVIWLTGAENLVEVRELIKEQPVRGQIYIAPGTDRMDQVYALSTLAVGRAGGSFLAELLVCGIPALLFPLPQGADRHQHHNAAVLLRHHAAEVFDEDSCDCSALADRILRLMHKPEEYHTMQASTRKLACPSAGRDLARLVVETATERGIV